MTSIMSVGNAHPQQSEDHYELYEQGTRGDFVRSSSRLVLSSPVVSNKSKLSVSEQNFVGDETASPVFLPRKIANAIVNVYEALDAYDLSQTQRRVMACLIRFGVKVDSPASFIFLKKATIASKLKISEATIYRCLATLESFGLIEREEQRRTPETLKVIGRIRLTGIAIDALGLTPAAAASKRDMAQAAHIEEGTAGQELASVRDNNLPPQSSSKKQPAEPAAFRRIEGKAVPSDLAWLVEDRSLSLPGLFGLMKRARNASTRLSDVVQTAYHAITELRGRDLFAYLAALIKKPLDFTFVANAARAERDRRQEEEGAKAKQHTRITTLAASLRGRVIADPSGGSWSVDEASVTLRRGTGRDAATNAWPLALALPQLEFLAQLAAGQPVSAPGTPTPATRSLRAAIADHLDRARAIVGARRAVAT